MNNHSFIVVIVKNKNKNIQINLTGGTPQRE